jgi:hypothetical protein
MLFNRPVTQRGPIYSRLTSTFVYKIPRSFIACVLPIKASPTVQSYHLPGRSAPTLSKIRNISVLKVYFQWFHWSYKHLLLFRFLLSNRKVSLDQKYQEILFWLPRLKSFWKEWDNNSTMHNIYDINKSASIVRKSNPKEHGVIV